MRYADPPGHPECMTAALSLCPHIALGRHRRARADRPGVGMIRRLHGDKPDRYLLGITRAYRTRFIPEHGSACVDRLRSQPCVPICTGLTGGYARPPTPGRSRRTAGVRFAAETSIDSNRSS
ncbi:hypothetical protein GCM10029963_72860 [Micromonospora andamanensis]|nr:hypothetical protein Vwe01_30490 [Micromonospora andamanensis]